MNDRVKDVLSKTFLFLEKLRAKQPSDAQVYRVARLSAEVKFRDIEARDFLVKHFRGQRPALDLAENGKSKSGTREEIGQETGKKREDATRRRRTTTNTITAPQMDFDALEADVAIYVAIAAAENASGKITAPRVLALRAELHALMLSMPREQFATGLRCANSHNAPNITYVRKCAKPSNVTPLFPVDEPIKDKGPNSREYPADYIDVFLNKTTGKWFYSDEWVKAKGLSSNAAG